MRVFAIEFQTVQRGGVAIIAARDAVAAWALLADQEWFQEYNCPFPDKTIALNLPPGSKPVPAVRSAAIEKVVLRWAHPVAVRELNTEEPAVLWKDEGEYP